MNFLDNLTPPNMDTVCVVELATTTCSDPWNYYKGYGMDMLITTLACAIILVVLLKR